VVAGALGATTLPAARAAGFRVGGKVPGGEGYTVLLLAQDGRVRSARLGADGKFTFAGVPRDIVRGATLQLVDPAGRYFGPVVLAHRRRTATVYTALAGRDAGGRIKVGPIALRSGYGVATRRRALVDRSRPAAADHNGQPAGAGRSGLVPVALPGAVSGVARAPDESATTTGADLDGDGIPNAADVDDDGDLNLDGTDGDSAGTSARHNPFTTLFLSLPQTLNVNVGGVTRAAIDAVIGGENLFNLIFFLSLPPGSGSTTGAHVICGASLAYCRSTADGGGTAVLTGVVESDPAILGGLWTDYDADGSGYPNLEPIGTPPNPVWVAGVQPRVGTGAFRPGDVYQVEFVNEGTVVSSLSLSLAPYFVTVPAVVAYDAGGGEVAVDYSDPGVPGGTPANPIALSAAGTLRLTLWRPQRLAIEGVEPGEYVDMGRLHYGVIVGGVPREFTCAGMYSDLSPTLAEDPDGLGAGGSEEAGQGANLWPLTDAAADAVPDPARTLAFTVDLAACLARAAVPAGTYPLSLTAAGESLSGGANRAAQIFYVTIP
jgi:hypothetical protein